MINSRCLVVGTRVIRDGEDNKISVIDVLDSIVVESFPVVIPRTSIAWFLYRDSIDEPPNYTGTLSLSIGEQTLQTFPIQGSFEDKLNTRLTVVIGGMVLDRPGKLCFRAAIPANTNAEFVVDLVGPSTAIATTAIAI